MGIGLFVEAKIRGRGLLGRKPGRDRLFSDLRQAIQEYLTDPLMARLSAFGSHEHTLFVRLHPCAESVEFIWKPDQSIAASAKTSTVGPGYHAFLIELLQHLGESLNLKWEWNQENADEAGFVESGDFVALQQEMARFWKSLGHILLEQAATGCENLMLNMSINCPLPQIDTFVVTPLGPLSRECCDTMQAGKPDDLVRICRQYFVWWDKEPNAAFWRNTGISLMWCDVPWHIPYAAGERSVSQLALDCLNRAKELDGTLSLPAAEIEELRSLLEDSDEATPKPPATEGIGYRRHEMLHQLTGGWSFCLPGYYYYETGDDGAEQVYWFGNRTIRFTSFTATEKEGTNSSLKDRLGPPDSEESSSPEVIDLDKGHIVGRAIIKLSAENGHEFWMLQGKLVCSAGFAIMTICFDDPADKSCAVDTFMSITYPTPHE
jgi:hypothetical protein